MNPIDDQLNRLLRAAASPHGQAMLAAPPFGLETRVMAAWRGARSMDAGFWDMTLLVRGLVLASVIMAVSFWPALHTTTNPFAEFLQVADTTVPSDESP